MNATLLERNNENGCNVFKGDEIESLSPDDALLHSSWTLLLKDGRKLKLALDWRGMDCYIGLYTGTTD